MSKSKYPTSQTSTFAPFALAALIAAACNGGAAEREEELDSEGNPILVVPDGNFEILGDPDAPPQTNGTEIGGDPDIIYEPNKLDLLFIIDNSASTGKEQENLAKNFPGLVRRLQQIEIGDGDDNQADVQIMVITTDMENAACAGETKGETMGRPVTTGCNSRIENFTDFRGLVFTEACTGHCPEDVTPENGESFIAFHGGGTNVPDSPDVDVDGDGDVDDNVARALACIGPQGVDGCWHEAPLDSMMAALDSGAAHNQGGKPFFRKEAMLAVAIITDEADCSLDELMHPEVFDPDGTKAFWAVDPGTADTKRASSAICWNAGVSCDGPDADGEYSNCTSTDAPLTNISKYQDFLHGMIDSGKDVVMLGILGIPEVTEHSDTAPYEPTEGGADDIVYRDWKDGAYPDDGDILPGDSRTAADMDWTFGIGPGCTGGDEENGFTGQAIPPVRIKEVCESLNGEGRTRCCMESICDSDFSDALNCLAGLIEESVKPVL